MFKSLILLLVSSYCLIAQNLTAQNQQVLKPASNQWSQITRNALFEKRLQHRRLFSNPPSEKTSRLRSNLLSSRIVGGKEATAQAYPWMAAITSSGTPNLFLSQFCGGSLIHPHWILTAAHCVVGETPDSIQVVLGAHDLTDPTGIQRLNVDEIILHPKFTEDTVTNFDVALLRLSQPANSQFTPIALIDDDSLEEVGTLARVIGWGNTSATGSQFPTILQEVDVPIVSLASANSPSSYNNQITRFMLPAGFTGGGQDSCQGDSGGPLMVPSPLSTGWSIAGIVSFGSGCAQPNFFGIYTSVSTFRDFVLSHIYPNYLLWEETKGIRGELRDPDGDQLNNLAEFAFNTSPQIPDTPLIEYRPETVSGERRQAITLQTPSKTEEIDYSLLHSTDLQSSTQQTFDLEALTTNTLPLSGRSDTITRTVVTKFSADEPQAFFQVGAAAVESPTTGPRTLHTPGGANGYLTTNDLIHPDFPARNQKLFFLADPPPGQIVTISGRSTQFDMRLELLNADTLEVLQVADSNNALGLTGQDEFLTLIPDSEINYLIRLTSAANGQTGSFNLGCFLPNSLPVITETSSVNAALQSSDATDPTREPHRAFIEQFHLANHSFASLQLRLTSSFDSNITVIDLETGSRIAHVDQFFGTPDNVEILNFRPTPGQDYLIQVSSFSPNETGSFRLELSESISAPAVLISTSQILTGSLDSSDPNNGFVQGALFDDYRLNNSIAGQQIRIDLRSNTFNNVIELIHDDTEQLLAISDLSAPTINSSLIFTVQPGVPYRIRATSFSPGDTGNYTLETTLIP